MSEQQLLRDANIEPTGEVIAECLGSANSAYSEFMEEIQNHDIVLDWRYYNDGKAWLGKGLFKWSTVRGTQKEMTVFWLSIWEGFFKVAFYIPEKYRADAADLALDDTAKKMIEDAKQMGKLKFFPVVFELHSDRMFDTVFTLMDFKKTLK